MSLRLDVTVVDIHGKGKPSHKSLKMLHYLERKKIPDKIYIYIYRKQRIGCFPRT